MRIKIYKDGGNVLSTGNTFPGGTLTGPLILRLDPITYKDAVNKKYVDSVLVSLSADNIISGTIPNSTLPVFTGDVVSVGGDNVLSLSTTGVVPGSYTKVIVDNKGRVTDGTVLVSTDIPALDWSKIVSGKPTTLNGYGITDAINITGGVLNSFLNYTGAFTDPLHAVNKAYVDALMSTAGGIHVGDMIREPKGFSPTGYLRCNGAILSKTSYPDLYIVIGDTFNNFQQPGSGKPWKNQYEFNLTQNGDITGWTTSTTFPTSIGWSQAVITKNRVYMLGGYDGTSALSTIYSAPINPDGTLGAWSLESNLLPGPIYASQAIVTKNRVYLLGGINNVSVIDVVYTAPINPDGTLGAWSLDISLPGPLAYSQAVITRNRVYLLGGTSLSNYTSSIYYADINNDGTLGTWIGGTTLPTVLTKSQVTVTKNKVYLIGGFDGTNWLSTIYSAPINPDGTLGTWSLSSSLPYVYGYPKVFTTNDFIYIISGYDGTVSTTTVLYAPILVDGSIGTWSLGSTIVQGAAGCELFTTSSNIFLIGGHINITTYTPTVQTAPILGGLNDYSGYYDGTYTPLPTNDFVIPDTTLDDINYNINTFIKY